MKEIGNEIEIYFHDLNEDAQKKFLKVMGIDTSEEGNYDVIPIAIVPVPEIDDGKIMEDNLNRELTADQINAVRDWALPGYERFMQDMKNAGIKYEDYHGRFFYHGPAVRTDEKGFPTRQDVIRATKVKLQWDNLGRDDYIVYPVKET